MKQKCDHLSKKISGPSPFNLLTALQDGFFRIYAWQHKKRGFLGGVYDIPLGYRMWLPIAWGASVAARRFGRWEPRTTETFKSIVTRGMTIIEIGACYGYFTLLLSKLVGSTGKIYSFEAFPPHYAIAQRNLQLNNVNNVILINKAVGDRTNRKITFDNKVNPYSSFNQLSGLDYSLAAGVFARESKDAMEVKCVALSDFLKHENIKMDLLFMDIEGCELVVLKDIEKELCHSSDKPILFFELHRDFYKPGDMEYIDNFFVKCNYSIQAISGTHYLCMPKEMKKKYCTKR